MPGAQCSTANSAITQGRAGAYISVIATRRLVNLRREERAGRTAVGRIGRQIMLFRGLLLQRYRAWKLYRETYAALAALDLRTLADIGVSWADIKTAARRAAVPARA